MSPSPAPSPALSVILAKLREASKRLTRQRQRILEVLLDSREHLDVEQIRHRASLLGVRVSYATVYRTMRLLADAGIVNERHFADGSARFEYARDGQHHDHLICTRCGAVLEFFDESVETAQEVIARRHGFLLTGHRHEIYGTCAACAGKT